MPQQPRSPAPIQAGAPTGGTGDALSQFMAQMQQSMNRMLQSAMKLQQSQAETAQQAQQQVASTVTGIANKISTDIEKREAKAEQKAEQAAGREFQLDVMDYQQQLAKDFRSEQERVTQLKQQQLESVKRHLLQFEEQKSVIPAVNSHVWETITKLDHENYWDNIPDGQKRRAQIVNKLRHAESWNESHHSSSYTDSVVRQLYSTLEDIQAGGEYVDLRDIQLSPDQLPFQSGAIMTPDGDPKEYSPEDLVRIKNRQGWFPGGQFGAAPDDQDYSNPWTYGFMMKAMAQDELYNNLMTQQGRKKYIQDRLRNLNQALPMLENLEKMQVQVLEVFSPLAGPAVEDGLVDFTEDLRSGKAVGDPKRELARRILGRLFQSSDPKYAALAMEVSDPSNPLRLEAAGDMVGGLTVAAGLMALEGHTNLVLSSDDQGGLGRLAWDLAERDPRSLMAFGLNERDIAALRSEGDDDLVRKTSATRKFVHRLVSGVQHEFRNIGNVIDEQPAMKSMREDFGVLARDLDTTLMQWQSSESAEQKEFYRTKMEEMIGQAAPPDMAPEEWENLIKESQGAMGEGGFGRAMNQLESMVELFHAVPNKQASIFDLYSGGKGGMVGPNAGIYQAATPILAQSDPAVRERLDRYTKDYLEPLRNRAMPPQAPAQQPGGPSADQGLGAPEQFGAAGGMVEAAKKVPSKTARGIQTLESGMQAGVKAAGYLAGPTEGIGRAVMGEKGLDIGAMTWLSPKQREEYQKLTGGK